MGAIRHILVSSETGDGRPESEVRVAGLVTLLQRRARTPVVLLSPNPERSAVAHPDLTVVALDAIAAALVDCEFLCVTGELRTEAAVERAVRHVLAARLAGIPVALVAVDVDGATTSRVSADTQALVAEILAGAESISASDARSAQRLAQARGRRVETTAPPELVLELAPLESRTAGAIDARLLDRLGAPERTALAAGLRRHGITRLVLLGAPADDSDFAASTRITGTDWRAWSRAVGECAFVCTADAAASASAVLACGAVPIVRSTTAEAALHVRIGLASCVVDPVRGGAGAWSDAIGAALGVQGRALAARVAPLRSLAWRALGPLAEAVRAADWDAARASSTAKTLAAEACALLVQAGLEAGDALAVEGILQPHAAALGTEPAWAEARARAFALQGRDGEATALLESALARHADAAPLWAALARARLRSGELDAARDAWQRVAVLRPTDAEPHAELGTLLLFAGRIDAALAAWQDAQRREPGHAASARAVRACLESDPEREGRFWSQLAAENPRVAAYLHAAGLACERAGAYAAAEQHLGRATEIAPECTALWDALGRAVAHRDADGAKRIFERARALEAAPTP